MLAALFTLSLLQAPDLSKAGLRELVALVPRSGEPSWAQDPADGRLAPVPALAELRQRLENGAQLDLECWRVLLIDKGYLHWREKWPVSEPFAVSLHLPALAQGYSVRLEPAAKGWKAARASHWEMMCGLGEDTRIACESYQELGTIQPGPNKLRFEVVARPMPCGSAEDAPQRVGALEIDVCGVEGVDELLQRTDDAALGRTIAGSVRLFVARNASGTNRAWLHCGPAVVPATTACNFEVEVLHDGAVVATAALSRPPPGSGGDSCELAKLTPRMLWKRDPVEGWSLRLRGTSKGALRCWGATHYWCGTVEVPVVEILAR